MELEGGDKDGPNSAQDTVEEGGQFPEEPIPAEEEAAGPQPESTSQVALAVSLGSLVTLLSCLS